MKQQRDRDPARRMKRLVRVAEAQTPGPATGQTVIKQYARPVQSLIDAKEIGPEETRAAEDIEAAIFALCGVLGIGSISLDRVDAGFSSSNAKAAAITARVLRYQEWADYWSRRKKTEFDPMLEVVFAAVVDERSIRDIASEVGRHHRVVRAALAAGLRDYAARAGWVTGSLRKLWEREAEEVFARPVHVKKGATHAEEIERYPDAGKAEG